MATAATAPPPIPPAMQYGWYNLTNADPTTIPQAEAPSSTAVNATAVVTIPLLPSYPSVIYTIRCFNRDRLAYTYDPDNAEKQQRWASSRRSMQSILNRYYDLTPVSRDAVDICLDVWSASDVCFMVSSNPAE